VHFERSGAAGRQEEEEEKEDGASEFHCCGPATMIDEQIGGATSQPSGQLPVWPARSLATAAGALRSGGRVDNFRLLSASQSLGPPADSRRLACGPPGVQLH